MFSKSALNVVLQYEKTEVPMKLVTGRSETPYWHIRKTFFFEPPLFLNSVDQSTFWEVHNCVAHRPTFSGTKSFISAFTTSRHYTWSSARWIHSKPLRRVLTFFLVYAKISQSVLSLHFLFLNSVCAYHISHACCKLRPFNHPCFDHSHRVGLLQPPDPTSLWPED
jgi:hypothetical protein